MSITVKNFWGDLNETRFPRLEKDIQARHLIVGGGIAGLSTAYFLLERDEKDIVLIERNSIGSGATGHSSGMLVCEPETASWSDLVKTYGAPLARKYYDAQVSALTVLSKIVKQENVTCDFMSEELWILASNALAKSYIRGEFEARKLMKKHSDILFGEQLQREFTTKIYSAGERTKESISVNPLFLARGFAGHLANKGVRIYEQTSFLSAKSGHARTPNGKISYKSLFRCLGVGEKGLSIERYLSTICVTKRFSAEELKRIGITSKYMFFDYERRSFHYGKITPDNRLLIGYGDVKCKNEYKKHYVHLPHVQNITRFIEREFLNIYMPIEYSWSSQYALSQTDLPKVIVAEDEAIINGAGTQLASIATASYAVSKMLKKEHPLDGLFGKIVPDRKDALG